MLAYTIKGFGKSVVFLHGFLESSTMWQALEPEKMGIIRCVYIDLPGHGKSTNEDDASQPSLNYMAEQVMQTLTLAGVGDYYVVGHSMGGYVALLLKEMDVRCEKVILLNSNFWQDSEAKKRDRLRVADIVLRNKSLFLHEAIPNLYNDRVKFSSAINDLLEEALQMEAFAISYASIAMSNRKNQRNLIEKAPGDFLVIQGENDQIVPLETMQDEIHGLSLVYECVPDVGHMAHFENPSAVFGILHSYFEKNLNG